MIIVLRYVSLVNETQSFIYSSGLLILLLRYLFKNLNTLVLYTIRTIQLSPSFIYPVKYFKIPWLPTPFPFGIDLNFRDLKFQCSNEN